MNKLRKFLKRNEVIIDFVSKIIFGFFSIILLIIANNLVKEQNYIEKENQAPSFVLEEANFKDNKTGIKLRNLKGLVTDLKLEKIVEGEVMVSDLSMKYIIHYYNYAKKEKQKKENEWFFKTGSGKITYAITEKLREKLNERYPNYYSNVSVFNNYYKITYLDYQNTYKEIYYDDSFSLSYSNIRTDKEDDENNNDFRYVYTSFILTEETEEEIIKKIEKSIYEIADYYLKQKKEAYD